jgi:hypothetical protein
MFTFFSYKLVRVHFSLSLYMYVAHACAAACRKGMTLRVYLSLRPAAANVCVPREINWSSLGMVGIGGDVSSAAGGPGGAEAAAVWVASGTPTEAQDGLRLSRVLAGFAPVLSRVGFVPLGASLARLIGEIDKATPGDD